MTALTDWFTPPAEPLVWWQALPLALLVLGWTGFWMARCGGPGKFMHRPQCPDCAKLKRQGSPNDCMDEPWPSP